MQLRYNFRLYPTATQQAKLAQAFGCARVVYNDAIRIREEARAEGKPFPTTTSLSKLLITEAKKTPDREWLATASFGVMSQALRDLDQAYRNFFDSMSGKRKGPKLGPPVPKTKRDRRQTARYPRSDGFQIRKSGKLFVPKVGDVRVRWSRTLPSDPSSVTVIKDKAGRYFASFVVQTDPNEALPETTPEIGIDLGLTHFAVLSDGRKISSPRFLRRAQRKISKAQRSMSRKAKGSNNRQKAITKMARLHARVADARHDHHHKLSTALIRENQAVYVEDLPVEALSRGMLAKFVHDAGWSHFVNMLEYKATRYGRTFLRVDRWLPSSQTCHVCMVIDGKKPLSVRTWTCKACNTEHDRDVNAARVILAAGRAERQNACGGTVRPAA